MQGIADMNEQTDKRKSPRRCDGGRRRHCRHAGRPGYSEFRVLCLYGRKIAGHRRRHGAVGQDLPHQ